MPRETLQCWRPLPALAHGIRTEYVITAWPPNRKQHKRKAHADGNVASAPLGARFSEFSSLSPDSVPDTVLSAASVGTEIKNAPSAGSRAQTRRWLCGRYISIARRTWHGLGLAAAR